MPLGGHVAMSGDILTVNARGGGVGERWVEDITHIVDRGQGSC